ncbi:MAG: hypothetical protein Q9201_004873 [Fulgogasparrea decipioides]
MEFPASVATNVHACHLDRLHWTLYRYEQPTQVEYPEDIQEASRILDPYKKTFEQQLAVRKAVTTLRRSGFIVTYGHDTYSLWLFNLPRAHAKPPNIQHENVLKHVNEIPLKCVSDASQSSNRNRLQFMLTDPTVAQSGFVTPQQLRSLSDEPFTESDPSEENPCALEPSKHAFVLNAKGRDEHIANIYRAFISALTSSILFPLIDKGEWLEFGSDSCLRVLNDQDHALISDILKSRKSASQLHLDVRWSASGTLTVWGHLTQVASLTRLPEITEDDSATGTPDLRVGTTIFIAPFGAPYEFVEFENQLSSSIGVRRHEQNLTLNWLAGHGISSKLNCSWVCLRPGNASPQYELWPDDQSPSRIWWPSHLCFVAEAHSQCAYPYLLDRLANGTFSDPLEKAEEWFLGRTAREEATKVKLKQDEERKLRESQQSESIEHPAYDETIIDPMVQTTQYLSAQEAGGIYPTPPEGMASQSHGSFGIQDSTSAGTLDADSSAANIDQAAEVRSPNAGSPDVTLPGRASGRNDTHDLFGDMDTDMFDTNGLTEADFNFFDELDDREIDADIDQMTPALIESEVLSDETQGLATGDASRDRIQPPGTGNEEGGDTNVTENEHSSEPSDMSFVQENESKSHTLLEPTDTHAEGVECRENHGSFHLITLGRNPRDYNAKYSDRGRYAVSPPQCLTGSRPGRIQDLPNQELPKIGPMLDRSEDSSDEMEDVTQKSESLCIWDADTLSISGSKAAKAVKNSVASDGLSRKRKRESSADSYHLATPAESAIAPDTPESRNDADPCSNVDFPHHNPTKDLLSTLKDRPITTRSAYYGDDQDFIQIAQSVADQKTLQNGSMDFTPYPADSANDILSLASTDSSLAFLVEILNDLLPGIKQCDLKSFLDLDSHSSVATSASGTPSIDGKGVKHQTQVRSGGNKNQGEAIVKTQVPYLSVQRGKDTMDITPPALYFWEELGLAPVQQGKDVTAFCIYPDNDTIREAILTFFTTMESSYQSCRFGHHVRGAGSRKYQEGLVPVTIPNTNPETILKNFHEACESLGMELPVVDTNGTNYVVYMVDPFNDEAKFPHFCAAFLELLAIYAARVRKAGKNSFGEVVLQIVPLNFLANCDRLTIPPPKAYTKLAFEVYNRCSPGPSENGNIPPPYTSASAIRLARLVPKQVNFRLSPQPPPRLLTHDPCLHMAYSWHPDDQWLACAWTDNFGILQWNAVYCLGTPGPDLWAAFVMTGKEILDTTRDMLQPSNLPWRLHIVKDGPLHHQELDGADTAPGTLPSIELTGSLVWRFHSKPLSQQNVTISMLSIDSNPPLSFPPDQPADEFPLPAATLGTSPTVSTPYDQTLTPDHSSPATFQSPTRPLGHQPTIPSASGFTDSDPSARLIDIVSDAWAVIAPGPIPDPCLPMPHLAPVIASGYLLKRAGTEEEDGLIPLGINLISSDISKTSDGGAIIRYEKFLRDVLSMYSDLATLARLRGTEEWRRGVLPWHVAAARKARIAVSGCMRWGKKE